MKQESNIKIVIAWIILLLLIVLLLCLTYIKFYPKFNSNIKEIPVNKSSSNIVEKDLDDIINNFNNNSMIKDLESQNIKVSALRNNMSIFITYVSDVSTTYEFVYRSNTLTITVDNQKENLDKFNVVFKILVEATQLKLNNNINTVSEMVDDFLNNGSKYNAIDFDKDINTNTYYIFTNLKLELKEQGINTEKDLNDNNNEIVDNNTEDNSNKNEGGE